MARPVCSGTNKVRFSTPLDCNLAVARIQLNGSMHRKQARAEEPIRSYKCEFCFGWHMTSQVR